MLVYQRVYSGQIITIKPPVGHPIGGFSKATPEKLVLYSVDTYLGLS